MNLWMEIASIRSYFSPIVEKTSYIWIFSGRLNKFLNTTLNLSFFYNTQDYIQRDLPIGLRNHVFNDSDASLFPVYNKQQSVVKNLTADAISQTLGEKVFSKHTGSIYTISEQNNWILTLSFNDQFSKKIFSLSETTKNSLANYRENNLVKINNSCIGLVGHFIPILQQFSSICLKTFIFNSKKTFLEKKLLIQFYGFLIVEFSKKEIHFFFLKNKIFLI